MSVSRVKFYHSIRFKLSAIVALVIFAAVLALSIFNALNSLGRETKNFQALTTGAASAYAATVAEAVDAQDEMRTLSSLRGIRDLPNIVQVDVTLADGTVFTELGSGAWIVSEAESSKALWKKKSIRVVLPIVKGGREIAQLGMLADIQPLRAEILSSLYMTILAGALVGLIGIVAAQIFVSQLTAPLKKLTNAMSQIRDGEGQQQTTALSVRKDETGLLTNTFSDMIDTIRDRDQQIADHMDSLEQTVEDRTRDLRVARDEAEAANAAKSDFLATMSHEIRTPMNGMMVMAEMLGAADLTPRHKRYAEIIHRSGNSLLTIINDILDLSKIEAGQLDLEIIPTSPERLITDVSSLFWERARSKNLELATYVSPRVPAEVFADPTRVNQVISNLVNNALKFTEQGGVLIHLDAETVDKETCRLVFEVIDTGIGIPEDKIDHIFESFSQADQSTTRKFGGTGLGLTVCQRLIVAMDGDISVSSQPGKGSTFRVVFEAKVSEAAAQAVPRQIRVGFDLPDGVLKIALAQSLADAGASISDTDVDCWVTTSAAFQDRAAPTILLTDIGDTLADGLLKSGRAHDILPNPFQRSEVQALIQRANSGTYRGVDAVAGNAESATLESFEGLRVLAVDDNAVNREVLREALIALNADATFAENGEQALALFQQQEFDLVLMDGSMPVLDGFEATRQIRAYEDREDTAPTPLFALTAQVVGADETAWHDAGANGHILKPFTLEKLSSVFSGIEIQPAKQVSQGDQHEPDQVFDLKTVHSLEQLGGGDGKVRDRIWDMFFEKAPDMVGDLQQLAATGTTQDIARQAHALKSMALSSGFKAISEHLQSLEERAKLEADAVTFAQESDKVRQLIEFTSLKVHAHRSEAA
jgi:two-component system sensor histidine kinase BarA